jgi:DNA-binding CsgD family transcriptional regulator
MAKSSQLRVSDCREILALVGECRELGDDSGSWQLHGIERLARLVDADLGFGGEMSGCLALRPKSLGVADWGWENGFKRSVFVELSPAADSPDPVIYSPAMNTYFGRMRAEDGVCHSRTEIIGDREYEASFDYQVIHRSYGVDHILWCFRSIPSGSGDEFKGVVLNRAAGRRDFDSRDRLIVREANAALAPLVGGPLARFSDPSPMDLSSRVREALRCLLEGDGDKQIAARMRLSVYTVNQYTKVIYRHFGVEGRAELLSRWIRRRWGIPSPHTDRGG